MPRLREGSGRYVAAGAALLVVLALVGIVVMLRANGASRAGGVTATTPPDAVHVVITKDASYSTVQTATPGTYTMSGAPYHAVLLDKTFTDAATAQRIQQDLTPDASTTPPANVPLAAPPLCASARGC